MDGLKAALFQDLKKQVALLQHPHALEEKTGKSILPPSILAHLPNRRFPTQVIHECMYDSPSSFTAGNGFVWALAASLNRYQKPIAFISAKQFPYPPSLLDFGINPSLLLHLTALPGKKLLSTIEECLRSDALGLVIGCCDQLDFTASRRMQLAAEQGSTGFLFRPEKKFSPHSAAACRWKIKTLPSYHDNEIPGLGYPCWNLSLCKVRNGRPGNWSLCFRQQHLFLQNNQSRIKDLPLRKTGS